MRTGLLLVCTVFVASAAWAQPASSPGALSTRVKTGDTVYVLDTMSREVTGVFGRVSDTAISLTVDGAEREIPFSEVRRVTRRGGDSLWNGVLIGAGVGALGGSLQGARMALTGAALYGALGAFIDSQKRGRVVVYSAPGRASLRVVPMFVGGRRAIQVALLF